MGPFEKIIELENEALTEFPKEARYRIDFDNNQNPLRVILDESKSWAGMTNSFIYRRGELDLSRDQAADLIFCDIQFNKGK